MKFSWEIALHKIINLAKWSTIIEIERKNFQMNNYLLQEEISTILQNYFLQC